MKTTQRLRDVLTLPSGVKFKLWSVFGRRAPLPVKTTTGMRAMIRPQSSDYDVFYEVFVKRVYDPPPELDRKSVRLVLDLGGNVGYSNLFWLEIFPAARVVTYEPHPAHVELAHSNFRLNGATRRIQLRAAAAGTCEGHALLSSNGSESAVQEGERGTGIDVAVADLFKELPEDPVDLLKIDIEGGEFALVADERFHWLRPRAVCMETHPYARWSMGTAEALRFWASYWADAGYAVSVRRGILWGIRK